MKRAKRHESAEIAGRDRWLISYADLVTLLLGLFIVLYGASDSERARVIAESFAQPAGPGILEGGQTPDTAAVIEARLMASTEFSTKGKVRQSKDGVIISLSEAGFFAAGEAEMNSDSGSAVAAIAEALRESAGSIRVEGHTDSTPISTARFPSNWELSTARAANVLSRLVAHGVQQERLSAAGFAGFRPVQDNSTAEGRAQNRRVDIVLASH